MGAIGYKSENKCYPMRFTFYNHNHVLGAIAVLVYF